VLRINYLRRRRCVSACGENNVVVKIFLGLVTKTETWVFRSRDQDRDLDKMNSSAFES